MYIYYTTLILDRYTAENIIITTRDYYVFIWYFFFFLDDILISFQTDFQ